MSSAVALVTIHGMGRTQANYADAFFDRLSQRVNPQVWANTCKAAILYQNILQENQDRQWKRMALRGLRWGAVRRYLLFGFSDATAIFNNPHQAGSVYLTVQRRIRETLEQVLKVVRDPETQVVLVAHSLGAHVLSCYLWDALHDQGVWAENVDRGWNSAEIDFLKLKTTRVLFTIGCNIPIFVAGLKDVQAIPPPSPHFEWYNYYDNDDPFGWPLRPLSDSYKHVVTRDIPVESGNWYERFLPLSHLTYYRNRLILDHISQTVQSAYTFAEIG